MYQFGTFVCVAKASSYRFYTVFQVGADDEAVLDQIIDSLNSLANKSERDEDMDTNSLVVGKVEGNGIIDKLVAKKKTSVLILGAGRVCQPAVQLLASGSRKWLESDPEGVNEVEVIVGSLFLKEAEEVYYS